MKLSKREKVLIILVLIIGGAAAYIFLFLQPCLNEISRLNSQNESNQRVIQTNGILKKSIDQIIQGISDNEKQIAEFGDNVNSAFDQPAVLVYLYETMNKYGEKVLISFDKSGDLGKVKSYSISVTMNGTYEALKNVMKDLSEGEYFVKVTGLTVTRNISSINNSATQDTASDDPDTTNEPSVENTTDIKLSINMILDFYNIGDSIPPDKTYDFTGGAVQYGGDIFGY